jgi:hypothetical protein
MSVTMDHGPSIMTRIASLHRCTLPGHLACIAVQCLQRCNDPPWHHFIIACIACNDPAWDHFIIACNDATIQETQETRIACFFHSEPYHNNWWIGEFEIGIAARLI